MIGDKSELGIDYDQDGGVKRKQWWRGGILAMKPGRVRNGR